METIEICTGRALLKQLSEKEELALAIVTSVLVSLIVLKGPRYKEVFEMFSKESATQRRVRGWLVVAYGVAIWVLIGVLASIRNRILGH